jgi:hypothetical protein
MYEVNGVICATYYSEDNPRGISDYFTYEKYEQYKAMGFIFINEADFRELKLKLDAEKV